MAKGEDAGGTAKPQLFCPKIHQELSLETTYGDGKALCRCTEDDSCKLPYATEEVSLRCSWDCHATKKYATGIAVPGAS